MLDSLNALLIAAETGIKYETRQAVLLAFAIIMVVASIAIIVVIMMQKGSADNVSAVTGASQQDSFYGKNKAKDKEGILKKVTLGLFIFILVCAVICFIVGIVD